MNLISSISFAIFLLIANFVHADEPEGNNQTELIKLRIKELELKKEILELENKKQNQNLQPLNSQVVKQRVILSRLVVETASNSFHLSMSPSSVLAGGFWSDLYGHDLRNTQALFSTKANDYRHC